MYYGKRLSVILLILAGLLLFCGCEQTKEEKTEVVPESNVVTADPLAAEKAEEILQAELDKEVKNGRLERYEDLCTTPLMAETGEDMQVEAAYTVHFGSGITTGVKCILTMKQKPDGTFSEVRDKREYEILGDSIGDNFSWIIAHPYVAWISKEDVYGKDRDEIASILFCQWMDTLKDWNTSDRTFLVTKYDTPEVDLIVSTDAEEWGTIPELEGPRPKHPGSLGSWIYSCQCRYQYLGYTSNVSLGTGWSGKAVGVEPFWVEDFAPGLTAKHFVLTEWQDSYTLETRKHCLGSIGKTQ
ncbi:MAG: hypothetical protein HFE73_04220 [Firmicutes bacterium]|nr:hypothetical protein [Bacillota bacterium]